MSAAPVEDWFYSSITNSEAPLGHAGPFGLPEKDSNALLGLTGPIGPTGPTGPTGPIGPVSTDPDFIHLWINPSSTPFTLAANTITFNAFFIPPGSSITYTSAGPNAGQIVLPAGIYKYVCGVSNVSTFPAGSVVEMQMIPLVSLPFPSKQTLIALLREDGQMSSCSGIFDVSVFPLFTKVCLSISGLTLGTGFGNGTTTPNGVGAFLTIIRLQ